MSGKAPKPVSARDFHLIDLFSGAGGLTLGFSRRFGHKFSPVWANDYNRESVDTYNANFGVHCVYGDIVSILEEGKIKIPKADLVIAEQGLHRPQSEIYSSNRLFRLSNSKSGGTKHA
jgi:C-5 cytosine-specific DNA methylase